MRHQQRGMIFIMFVVVLAIVGIGMVMVASTFQAQAAASRQITERRTYLDGLNRKLQEWYQLNLSSVDSAMDAPDMDAVIASAGIPQRYGMRVTASRRLDVGGVAYRRFVAWLPISASDTSTFDVDTGIFTPAAGVDYTVVDGLKLQQKAISETRHTLNAIALTLVNYFAARYELGGKDVSVNYFRPDSTCASTSDGMPCVDTYTPIASIDLSSAGMPALPAVDAWGNAIEVSNLLDSNVVSPPYSMAIRSQTPFGTTIVLNAYQRL